MEIRYWPDGAWIHEDDFDEFESLLESTEWTEIKIPDLLVDSSDDECIQAIVNEKLNIKG